MTGLVRILVTGFSEFPGVPDNPSATLVAGIARASEEVAPDAHLETAILTVEYGRGLAEIRALCRRINPDIVISFGVDSRARGLRVEQFAHNRNKMDRPDARGHYPLSQYVHAGGPERLPSRLPVARLEDTLRKAGLPVEASESAGDYLCNAVFYDTLHNSSERPNRWSGFVHIPMPSSDGMSVDDIERGARLIIQSTLSHHRDERSQVTAT